MLGGYLCQFFFGQTNGHLTTSKEKVLQNFLLINIDSIRVRNVAQMEPKVQKDYRDLEGMDLLFLLENV